MPAEAWIWLAPAAAGLIMSTEEPGGLHAGADIGAALKLAAIADANSGSSSSQSPSVGAPLVSPASEQTSLAYNDHRGTH